MRKWQAISTVACYSVVVYLPVIVDLCVRRPREVAQARIPKEVRKLSMIIRTAPLFVNEG